MLRTSLRPGLLQAIAFNESHRRTGVRLFEIGHVYPPGDGELPDEYEALARRARRRARRPAAMAVWRELSSALGVGARVDQSKPPAGLHPTRSATLPGRPRPDRRRRRGAPRRARAFDVDRARRGPRARPRPAARQRAETGAVEADQPLPVERSRPGVRAARRRRRPSGSTRRSGRARGTCSSTSTLFDVYPR